MIPPILAAFILAPLALIPLATLVQHLRDDAAEAMDLLRLTARLPPPRQNLASEWPRPLTAMDLPSLWDPAGRKHLRAAEAPFIVELHIGGGRHRVGEAPGTDAQRLHWNSPTGQFWAIVEQLGDLDEPCSHCAAPEDGERAHAGCPGCCCPCGAVPELPVGVAGYPIAGRTR